LDYNEFILRNGRTEIGNFGVGHGDRTMFNIGAYYALFLMAIPNP